MVNNINDHDAGRVQEKKESVLTQCSVAYDDHTGSWGIHSILGTSVAVERRQA